MLDIYTIASSPTYISTKCNLQQFFNYQYTYQAKPGMKLPIIVIRQGAPFLTMATWGMQEKASAPTRKTLITSPYNKLIRNNRCAIPANCFFAQKGESVYLIRLIQPRMFLMGGLFIQKNNRYEFIILKTPPPDILSFLNNMPVLFTPDKLDQWLKATTLLEVMNITDRTGSHWFDYFNVHEEIMVKGVNDKALLTPIGTSFNELKIRDQMLNALSFDQERPNRSNMKH